MRSDAGSSHGLVEASPPAWIDLYNLQSYSSPLTDLFRDRVFDHFCKLPRIPPSLRTYGISDLIHEFDLHWAELENGSTRARGNRNQSGGTGNRQRDSNRRQQFGLVDTSKPGASHSQKNKRPKKDESDNESDPPSKRRSTNPDSPIEAEFRCRIYSLSNREAQGQHKCRNLSPFTKFRGMVQHLLSIHFKPYQCSYCWSRYGRISERNRHQRIFCKRMGHPVESQVPDYVVELSKKVKESTEENLDGLLFLEGRKQYDFADGTDVMLSAPAPGPMAPGDDDISQLPNGIPENDISIPGPAGSGPELLAPNHQDSFLAQLDEEVLRAEQLGPESVEQLARQIASRLSQRMLGYLSEPQRTASPVTQMDEDSSEQQDSIASSQPPTVDSGTNLSEEIESMSDLHTLFRSDFEWMDLSKPFDNLSEDAAGESAVDYQAYIEPDYLKD